MAGRRVADRPQALQGGRVYDLVYNPLETTLLRWARERGLQTIDGLEMLVAQACRQFEWWTGVARPDRRSSAAPPKRSWDNARSFDMKQTSFEEFVELSRRGTFVPVCREIMADLLTPVSAFLKIAEHSDYAFLLESVEGGEHVGRYSFLGKDPFLDRCAAATAKRRSSRPACSTEPASRSSTCCAG